MRRVRRARSEDRRGVAVLRARLWPDASIEEHLAEVDAWLATGMNGTLPSTTFVSDCDEGVLAGFLEVGLRSHADGCDTLRPVAFIVHGCW